MIRVAIANPTEPDGLTRTVIDGAIGLAAAGEIEYRLAAPFDYPLPTKNAVLDEPSFIRYARDAHLIIFPYSKRGMQRELVEATSAWKQTIFLDGSEVGKNRRQDPTVRAALASGFHRGAGGINEEMLGRCPLYFRRERPYPSGVLPLPFGIETRYCRFVRPKRPRDIDFFCVFGQEEFPPLRREVRLTLETFCREHGLRCVTKKTWTQDGFYRALARSKVGISVSGGGFDSFRFWETLGAGCRLLTETIDIEPPRGTTLDYGRIHEFSDVASFKAALERMAVFLKDEYAAWDGAAEYERIISEHSSVARVQHILTEARKIGLISES